MAVGRTSTLCTVYPNGLGLAEVVNWFQSWNHNMDTNVFDFDGKCREIIRRVSGNGLAM